MLAASDKETIEAQQKKMNALRGEIEQLKQKYNQLKRNYDSVSLHAKKDAAENQRMLDMKEGYEAQIKQLKNEHVEAENSLKEAKQQLQQEQALNKEHGTTIANQVKEIDQLKRDMARQQKGLEG